MHRIRAKRFYYMILRDAVSESCLAIYFDLQQNQPLARVVIWDVFYKRQLWLHNLTVAYKITQRKENSRYVHMD